jgi:hypothetical protein
MSWNREAKINNEILSLQNLLRHYQESASIINDTEAARIYR